MEYKKLTDQQRSIKHWRDERNRIVGELLAKDHMLSRADALYRANEMMRNKNPNRKSWKRQAKLVTGRAEKDMATLKKEADLRMRQELRDINFGERVRLTREMIQAGLLNNMWFYTDRQKELLGTDGSKGWMKAMTGRLVSKKRYEEFLRIADEQSRLAKPDIIPQRKRDGEAPAYQEPIKTIGWIGS